MILLSLLPVFKLSLIDLTNSALSCLKMNMSFRTGPTQWAIDTVLRLLSIPHYSPVYPKLFRPSRSPYVPQSPVLRFLLFRNLSTSSLFFFILYLFSLYLSISSCSIISLMLHSDFLETKLNRAFKWSSVTSSLLFISCNINFLSIKALLNICAFSRYFLVTWYPLLLEWCNLSDPSLTSSQHVDLPSAKHFRWFLVLLPLLFLSPFSSSEKNCFKSTKLLLIPQEIFRSHQHQFTILPPWSPISNSTESNRLILD